MANQRRPLTEQEWASVRDALPRTKFFMFFDEIDRIKTCCWNCHHYDGFEGHPGKCQLHEIPIPNDQRGKEQECFEMLILPF